MKNTYYRTILILVVALVLGTTAEVMNPASTTHSTTHLRQLAAAEDHKNETDAVPSFFDIVPQWMMDAVFAHNSTENATRQADDTEGDLFANELCTYVFEPLMILRIFMMLGYVGTTDLLNRPMNFVDNLMFNLINVLFIPISIPFNLLGCFIGV